MRALRCITGYHFSHQTFGGLCKTNKFIWTILHCFCLVINILDHKEEKLLIYEDTLSPFTHTESIAISHKSLHALTINEGQALAAQVGAACFCANLLSWHRWAVHSKLLYHKELSASLAKQAEKRCLFSFFLITKDKKKKTKWYDRVVSEQSYLFLVICMEKKKNWRQHSYSILPLILLVENNFSFEGPLDLWAGTENKIISCSVLLEWNI